MIMDTGWKVLDSRPNDCGCVRRIMCRLLQVVVALEASVPFLACTLLGTAASAFLEVLCWYKICSIWIILY